MPALGFFVLWALAPGFTMSNPYRGSTSHSTYFTTTCAYLKKHTLQSDRMAGLLGEVLQHYRRQQKYLLHEFVVMPNHMHLVITASGVTLERAMQLIKGGFSYRAKRELQFGSEIWETSFQDRRVRDFHEYQAFRRYIHMNPVKRHLCEKPEDFPFSSAFRGHDLDPMPQRLKPINYVD